MWTVLGHGEVGPNPRGNPSWFDRSRSNWPCKWMSARACCCWVSRRQPGGPRASPPRVSRMWRWGKGNSAKIPKPVCGELEASKQSTTVGRARVADACGEFSFLFDSACASESHFRWRKADERSKGKAARQTSRSRSVDYSYESPTRDRHQSWDCGRGGVVEACFFRSFDPRSPFPDERAVPSTASGLRGE